MRKISSECISPLIRLSKISYSLCINTDTTFQSKLLSESLSLKNDYITYVEKLFAPPIEREDLVALALRQHSLNEKLFELNHITKLSLSGKMTNTVKELNILIQNICNNISSSIPNLLKLKSTDHFQKIDEYTKRANQIYIHSMDETLLKRHSPYEFFVFITLLNLSKSCFDRAVDISEYIGIIILKNT